MLRVLILVAIAFSCTLATLGVDFSQEICAATTSSDYSCLVHNGYSFAIIQTWQGGNQWNSHIGTCTQMAWNAGMAHVDVYAFICPNCVGNGNPATVATTIVNNLKGVKYGMLWFDVEQCTGCWSSDLAANCEYVTTAAHTATSLGVHVGIEYEWGATVGSSCTSLNNYPLWYAHYDGNPSFSDSSYYHFGGWTSPAIKQFNDQGPCFSVDVNWYPDSIDYPFTVNRTITPFAFNRTITN